MENKQTNVRERFGHLHFLEDRDGRASLSFVHLLVPNVVGLFSYDYLEVRELSQYI